MVRNDQAIWSEVDPADPREHFDFEVNAEGEVASVAQPESNRNGTTIFTRR